MAGKDCDKCLLRAPCKLRPVSGGAFHPCGERVITPTRLKPGNLAALVLGGGRDAHVAVDSANSRQSQEPNGSSSTLQRTLGNRFGADRQLGALEPLGRWRRQVARQPASSLDCELVSGARFPPDKPSGVVDHARGGDACPGLQSQHCGLRLSAENAIDWAGIGGEAGQACGQDLLEPGNSRACRSVLQDRRSFAGPSGPVRLAGNIADCDKIVKPRINA
jgi:hypothetical protein